MTSKVLCTNSCKVHLIEQHKQIISMAYLWAKESDDPSALYVDALCNQLRIIVKRAPAKNNTVANLHRSKGNLLFEEQRWTKALEKYNKSLRFAEPGSESMALAYANRASCRLHQHRYEDCLLDIELALKSSYPQHLLPYLMQLKCDCTAKGADEPPTKLKLELSYPANASIPCMADVLEIRQNEKFERYIVAKCDIPAGKTILIEPVVLSGNRNFEEALCTICQRGSVHLMPCELCTTAMFCSAECIEQSCAFHPAECGYQYDGMGDNSIEYLVRSILFAVHACDGVDNLMAFVERVRSEPPSIPTSLIEPLEKYRLFLQLPKKTKRSSEDIARQRAYCHIISIPEYKRWFNTMKKKRFLQHLIVMHAMILAANGAMMMDTIGNEACTLMLIHPLLKGACIANVRKGDVQGKDVTFTIRPVKAGEQLKMDSGSHRQQIFYDYGYWCECSKCVPIAISADVLSAMESDSAAIDQNDPVADDPVIKQAFRERCVEFLNKYGDLPFHPSFERVADIFSKFYEHSHY